MTLLVCVMVFVFGMAMHEVFPDNFWVATFMSIVGGLVISSITGVIHLGGI